MDCVPELEGREENTANAPNPLEYFTRKGLKELYQDQLLCDATIVAEGKRFPCHRLLMAAVSLYFKGIFTSSFKESQDGEVVLQDMASSIVQTILNYLYTGEISLTKESAQGLFVAASRLQVLPLLEICSSLGFVFPIPAGLKQLYQDEQLCDATIVAEGKRFPCHRGDRLLNSQGHGVVEPESSSASLETGEGSI
ncbi:ribosomal protein L17-like [Platysternon megacephalum]|uniref:Ribosomal protein L17-like n=1 Tax=Platysternon megacephalum TaxID=55544 RepID=A0A4D9ESQ2_9SAUR|nr:ribosomal protein L17-like [Platysternon megacephalum]